MHHRITQPYPVHRKQPNHWPNRAHFERRPTQISWLIKQNKSQREIPVPTARPPQPNATKTAGRIAPIFNDSRHKSVGHKTRTNLRAKLLFFKKLAPDIPTIAQLKHPSATHGIGPIGSNGEGE
ncbi:hypothetical protein RHGRI_024152 [Rhododendron griersonianum]|uniref:Uncharacterized protein n=1 Tax=Rhododendron griersonianum TaxID=479676 RepID=A0AAV6JDM2_9ERIC|nr:hypothetical protein RHGRI_024152 [Rhododendron griersonianum]